MGADLTYRCLGGYSYEITLSFYRDCAGIDADDSAYVNITSSCFGSDSIFLQRIPGTGQEISPICPYDTTTCNGGRFTGIQEYVYRGIVTLSGPCADWTFNYNLCCRNLAITNIDNPGQTYMYIYATLNNTTGICNNSPTFSNKPVPFACLGQQFCFNHGAYDVDGDSLVYSLITPYDSPGLPISYLPQFSATNPLSSSPAMTFNTMTGDICMTPTALEVTVMAVLVQEYRNGVLIGSVERDIQLTVLNCNNQLPTLTGINGTSNFSETICAGSQSCFTIYSSDADVSQHTYVRWDNSIPAGTFTVLPGSRENATFCWTPTVADISANPYCFTVTVNDDNCPYIGSQVYSFCITVKGITVDAGPDKSVGCNSYQTLTASASGGSGLYTYQWNNGATDSSITSGPGIYIVTASDGSCTNKDTVLIIAGTGVPTVDFSPYNSCLGTSVQFTDLTAIVGDTIADWHWDFGDGNTSTVQNPAYNYASIGMYTVLLVVHSGGGCVDTLVRMIRISNDQPTALFSSNNVCIGTPINFTDQSVTPVAVTNWIWNFGDAAASMIQNPTHQYITAGNYPVLFTITNSSGCTDSVTQTVIVHPLPVANAGTDRAICAGHSTTLTATGGVSYSWFPGVVISSTLTVTPPSTQSYIVTVTDANDCSVKDTVTITVNPNPVADAGTPQIICAGSTVTLTSSVASRYVWNPGGDTTRQIVVNPLSTTNYIVTVSNIFGCTDADQVLVTVNALPVANAGSDQSICYGDQVTLHGTGGGDYQWQPGSADTSSITFIPLVSATYLLTVTNAAGCNDTDHVSIAVNPIPVASFTNPVLICEGTVIQFANHSSVSSGTISTWDWNLGNNTSSASQNPSVLYTDTGDYHVLLIITSNAGCRDTSASVVEVAPLPDAVFNVQDVCFHDATGFTNSSSIISGEPLSYHWNFGDNSTATITNPNHTYSSEGYYTSTLIATSVRGCSDTTVHSFTVHPIPVAAFSNISVCENSPVYFTDLSTISADAIQSWNWNFGDSSGSIGHYPSHFYSSSGWFSVQLNLVSNFGCRDSVIRPQNIFPMPHLDFTGESRCFGDTIRFINLSSIAGGSIVQWRWEFGDHTLDYVFSPIHVYHSPGAYNVELSAVSDSGCITTISLSSAAVIHSLPEANFTLNTTEVEEIFPYVGFINQSSIDSSSNWNFGDGTFSAEFSPFHVYPHTGFYDVQLIVMDQNGCSDTAYSRIEVKPVTSLFIPNAFTPNGDGSNDTFHAYFTNKVSVVTQIFNRWGKKIYEWSDLNGSWDGTIDGSQAESDVYIYHLESIDMNGKKDVRIGHVSLIR